MLYPMIIVNSAKSRLQGRQIVGAREREKERGVIMNNEAVAEAEAGKKFQEKWQKK